MEYIEKINIRHHLELENSDFENEYYSSLRKKIDEDFENLIWKVDMRSKSSIRKDKLKKLLNDK